MTFLQGRRVGEDTFLTERVALSEMRLFYFGGKMNWFKHLVASTSDPDIMESEVLFKTKGPYVFWRVLELLAREDAIDEPITLHKRVFGAFFPSLSWRSLCIVMQFWCNKKRITWSQSENSVTIHCKKLADISSEYAKKRRTNAGQTPDNVRKNTPPEEEEEEEEVEVDVEEEGDKNKDYVPMAEGLRDLIKKYGTDAKITDRQVKNWANDFRLMVEQDGRTVDQIRSIVVAVFNDGFWKDNIRSAGTLRKQWNAGKLDRIKKSSFSKSDIQRIMEVKLD